MTMQLQGAPARDTFDPLLNANFAIWSNALERGGLYLMGNDEDGEPYCPLCEYEKKGGGKAADWITFAADEQLEKGRALGFVPGIQ